MKTLAIISNKLIRIIGKLVGKGSSLPGQVALKVDKDILSKIKLPKYIIAVTGSNGKTSTVEMIYQVLNNAGLSVAYNKEGSNQIEGVTTLILDNCDLSGNFKKDVLLIESDERYARHTFKYFHPTHYVITNLYRDQLTRNGHPEWIYNIIKDSIYPETTLILNGDDPLVSMFKDLSNTKTYFFGVDRYSDSTNESIATYNDDIYCPKCNHKLIYEYYHYNHIGRFKCPNCNLGNDNIDFKISEANLDESYLVIDDKYKINLALNSIYNAYNILATYSLCRLLNIDTDIICNTLNNYILKNGRVRQFKVGEYQGTLLTSKHENSVSYNQSLRVAKNYKGDVTAFIMVDAISRKYFTSETSWLWDIDFELLNSPNIKKVVLAGLYVSDIATRLEYTGIDFNKVYIEKDIEKAVNYLKDNTIGYIYVITCFSDQDKFLNRVEVLQ